MKRLLGLLFLASLVLLQACQKELSLEIGKDPSEGSLQSGVTDDCLPKIVAGAYEKSIPLNGTVNYIEVQVNVTKPGAYIIYTDTVNGIYFRAAGIFTTTGLNTVRLKGTGTPFNSGISNFIVTYGSTECMVSVTVLPAGGAVPAVFTLTGAPGTCMSAVVSGNYVAGTALTASNTVVINVNVTAIGTYNMTTPTSNGIVFSGSGTLGFLGAQTITLTASGTPVSAGNTNIPVTTGSSSCGFVIDVTSTVAPGDYFPTTTNSNWSYEFNDDPNDSLLRKVIVPTKIALGNTFKIFMETDDASSGFDSSGYYRKSGGDYYEFRDIGTLWGLDNPQWVDYIFLKDNIAAGTAWQSTGYSGTVLGSPITFRLNYNIGQKNVNITVNSVTYPNTIVVEERVDVFVSGTWQDATSSLGYYKSYYSRDVGLIRYEYILPGGAVSGQMELRRYQVF